MTKMQREALQDYLTSLLRRTDRDSDRLDKAEAAGDDAKVARIEARLDKTFAEIEGARRVLSTLGHYVQYQSDTNSYIITDDL